MPSVASDCLAQGSVMERVMGIEPTSRSIQVNYLDYGGNPSAKKARIFAVCGVTQDNLRQLSQIGGFRVTA